MEDSPSKPSVAELAGRLKAHIPPVPSTDDELAPVVRTGTNAPPGPVVANVGRLLPFPRRPPCSLKLQHPKQDNDEADKRVVSPNPLKLRMRSSPIIEKLQANLALSPTALLPSPKSPDVKLQPAPPSPPSPRGPPRPGPQPSQLSTEDEDPVGFDSPPDGAPLHSINKTRARLSFKRRPPTRQHRRSAGEEAAALGSARSPCEAHSPEGNGSQPQGVDSPAEEDEDREPGLKGEEDEDRDCEKTEGEGARGDPGDGGGPEEERASERAPGEGAEEEEERRPKPCPEEQTESEVMAEEVQEEMSHSAHHGGGDEV